ncbi:MAG TPA: Asp-tRNA(Asn)/Glu-tRNA(Gln) amidotransferase subunit GatB [Spirochaetota bacterium]|nr:Asp-tRNA(Asn)/Glu-tRNA(Gln) amidotransferase subunit GatB [Spirochaetota bacterium]HPN82764.1 Asp-tRNA(Asn)/Glu-tRNA(Gln) amidotransferase subunit GatB [Spirochaetota bacterium]
MEFEAVIGLEVHAQLNTQTKIFCSCANRFGAEPNTQTCPVCQGHPGVLPVLNGEALTKAIKAGLALDGSIAHYSRFDRKNYFYPDLPKAYQISQYEFPIVVGGGVTVVREDGSEHTFPLTRIHMEEDAGKLVHPGDDAAHSLVDLNRAGTPLIEIVSEPELHTPEDAAMYLTELRAILRYIDVSDCNMEEGSLRCDANVSIRPKGTTTLGTKVEIKNLNSIKGVAKAIEYEIRRQTEALLSGTPIIQETRLFDADREITLSMRSKEEAHDYRYFPDPDLVPVLVPEERIRTLKDTLPELPRARKTRFITEYCLTPKDVGTLCATRELADWFETAARAGKNPKKIANWIQAEVLRILNNSGQGITAFPVSPENTAALMDLVEDGVISGKIAKDVFEKMISTGKSAESIIEADGLRQVSDTGAIEQVIDEVLAANPAQVEQFKSGKTAVKGFLVGQIMKKSGGKVNPAMVNQILEQKLQS